MTYEQLETSIAGWAASQHDIQAVIAVGSRARGDADRWSDLDLILFTRERVRYADPDWLHRFGDAWLTYKGEAGPGDPEWFAIYDEGLKVDIVVLQVEGEAPNLETLMQCYPYKSVFARGVRVLFDRKGPARSLPAAPVDLPAPPSVAAFDHVVNEFLLESVTTAKFIARGDFWRAQHWLAHDLRPDLLKLIEWHASGSDTWYNGRFIERWADPRVLAALPQTFATAEGESMSSALRTMLELFGLMGQEAAARFGFAYPAETHLRISRLVERTLGEL